MLWFRHIARSSSDPVIVDAIYHFGGDAYYAYFGSLEILAREDCIAKPLVMSWRTYCHFFPSLGKKKLRTILEHFGAIGSFEVAFGADGESISIMSQKLSDLADDYARKRDRANKVSEAQPTTSTGKKEEQKKAEFAEDSPAMILSVFMWKEIKKWNGSMREPSFQSWAKSFDLMIRVDKKDPKWLSQAIRNVQSDAFWRKNILSPSKFREKMQQGSLEEVVNGPTGKNRSSSIPNRTAGGNAYDL